jgi:hypothetical protein
MLGRYRFSFHLTGGNVARTLSDMGFDVFTRRRTTRCVVVAPKGKAEGTTSLQGPAAGRGDLR